METPHGHQRASKGGHISVYIGNPLSQSFNTKEVRSAFVAKVYAILTCQLIFTTALIGLFVFFKPLNESVRSNGAWTFVIFGLTAIGFIVYFVLLCVQNARRSYPINFILLMIMTLCFGLIAAIASARSETWSVLAAVGSTGLSTIVIMLLARYAPFDITNCGCALYVLSMVHLFASILVIALMGHDRIGTLIIASLGAFLASLYLLFDLQLIMGGRSNELSEEEYILGAVLLYIDIINLFQYMLLAGADGS